MNFWRFPSRSIGHHREAEIIEQQLKGKQGGGGAPGGVNPMVSAATAAANGAGVQTPTMVQAGQMQAAAAAAAGQQDYSAQWAEYYRSIGKNDEAEAIEKQIQATKVRDLGVHLHFTDLMRFLLHNSG